RSAPRPSPSTPAPQAESSFFFSSRRRHTRWPRDWSSDVCSSDWYAARVRPGVRRRVDLAAYATGSRATVSRAPRATRPAARHPLVCRSHADAPLGHMDPAARVARDRVWDLLRLQTEAQRVQGLDA